MQRVVIYVACNFCRNESSPWAVKLVYGDREKILNGRHKARSESGLKAYALKMAIESIRKRCALTLFCEPGEFRDMVLDPNRPEMLSELMAHIGQVFWLRPNDLPVGYQRFKDKYVNI